MRKNKGQRRALLAAGLCFFWTLMTACSQSVIVPTGSATEAVEIIATVRETGPWLVLAGPEGFWAYGAGDGSLSHPETRVPLAPQDSTAMPAPAGGRVAYITGRDGIEDLALDILQLPDGHIESIALIPPEHMPAPGTAPGDPAAEAVRAIFERTSIAWSPDGEKLAFVGLLEAGNADLYVVEMEALEKPPGERVVLRLTASPEQEIQPLWSPDGEWVIYAAAADFGTGAGMALAGVRVVRADGSGDRLLYDTAGSGGETWVGWLDERTLVVHSWTAVCGSEGLRAVDLETGEARALWAGPFNGVALDPGTGSLLVAVDKFTSECGGAAGQGLYFVPGSGGEAARLTDQEAFLPVWAAEAGLFFARTPVEVLAVDPRGSALVVEAPGPVLPSAGRGGGLAWAVGEGIWVGSVGDAPVLVFEGNAALPAWSADGEVLYFLGEAGLYRVVGGQVALFGEGVMGSVGFWVRP